MQQYRRQGRPTINISDPFASWLKAQLKAQQVTDFELLPVAGDASFRRYWRVKSPAKSFIATTSPPDLEDNEGFFRVAEYFARLGLNVPKIIALDRSQGFYLQTDLGDHLYLPRLQQQPDHAGELYHDAIDALQRIQTGIAKVPELKKLPRYDDTLLQYELDLGDQWFVQQLLGIPAQHNSQAVHDLIKDNAQNQIQVPVHRDYHSRNLLRCDNNPGIIDFQDAVFGPISYDLVSLLCDCYIDWPQARVKRWIQYYCEKPAIQDLLGASINRYQQDFDFMVVQRHWKAMGIFARKHLRDGASGFLQDIPRCLNYVEQVCAKYPQLKPLTELIKQQIKPAMAAQAALFSQSS